MYGFCTLLELYTAENSNYIATNAAFVEHQKEMESLRWRKVQALKEKEDSTTEEDGVIDTLVERLRFAEADAAK